MTAALSRSVPHAGAIMSRMHCQAVRRGAPAEPCDRFLGYVPFAIRFVGVAERAPDHPDRRIWVRCPRSDCHAWNIFEVIAVDG